MRSPRDPSSSAFSRARHALARAAARLRPSVPAAPDGSSPPVLPSPSTGRFSSSAPSMSIEHSSAAQSHAASSALPFPTLPSDSYSSLAPPRAPWLGRPSFSNGNSDSSLLSLSDPFSLSNVSVTAPPTPTTEAPVSSPLSSSPAINPLASPWPDQKANRKEGRWNRIRRNSTNLLKKHATVDTSAVPVLQEPTPPIHSPGTATSALAEAVSESPQDTTLLDLPRSHLPQQQHDTTDSPRTRSSTLASFQSTTEQPPSTEAVCSPYLSPPEFDLCPSLPPSASVQESGMLRPSYLTVAAPLDGLALSPGQIVDSKGKVLTATTAPETTASSPATCRDGMTPRNRSPALTPAPLLKAMDSGGDTAPANVSLPAPTTSLPDFLTNALKLEPELMPDTPALGPPSRSPIEPELNHAQPADPGLVEARAIVSNSIQSLHTPSTPVSLQDPTPPDSTAAMASAPQSPLSSTTPAPHRLFFATPFSQQALTPSQSTPPDCCQQPDAGGRPASPTVAAPRTAAGSVKSPRTSGLFSAGAFKRTKSPSVGCREPGASPSSAGRSNTPDVLSVLDSGAKRALYNCTLLKLQPRLAVALKEAIDAADEIAATGLCASLSADAGLGMGSSVMAAVAAPAGALSANMRALMATAAQSVDKGLVADLAFPRSMNSALAVGAHESAFSASRDLRAALGRSSVLVRLLAPETGPLPLSQSQEISSLQIRYGRELVPPAVVSLAGRAGPSARPEALAPATAVMPDAHTPDPTHGLARWVARPTFAERCREWVPQVDAAELAGRSVVTGPKMPLHFSVRLQALVGPSIEARDAVAPSAGPSQPGRQRRLSAVGASASTPQPVDSPFRRRRLSQALMSAAPGRKQRDKRMSLSAASNLVGANAAVLMQQDKRLSLDVGTAAPSLLLAEASASASASASARRLSTASADTAGPAKSRRGSAPWMLHSASQDAEDPDTTAKGGGMRRSSTYTLLPTSESQDNSLRSAKSVDWFASSSASPQRPSPLSLAYEAEEQDDVAPMRPAVPRSSSLPLQCTVRQSRRLSDAPQEFGALPEALVESDSDEEHPLSALWARRDSSQALSLPPRSASPMDRTSPSPQRPPHTRSSTLGDRLPLAARSNSAVDQRPLSSLRSASALGQARTRVPTPDLHLQGSTSPRRPHTVMDQADTPVDQSKRRETVQAQAREAQLHEAHKAMLKQSRDRRRSSRAPQTLLDPMYGAGHASARAPAQVYAGSHARTATQVTPSHRNPSETGLSGSGSASGTSAGTTSPTQPATPSDNGLNTTSHARAATPTGRKSPSPRVSFGGHPGWRSPGAGSYGPLVDLSRDGALRGAAPRLGPEDDDRHGHARRKSPVGLPSRSGSRTSMASAPGGMGGARTPTRKRDSWYTGPVPQMPGSPVGYNVSMAGMPKGPPMHLQQQMVMQQQMYQQHLQMQMGMMPPQAMPAMPMFNFSPPMSPPQPSGRRRKNSAAI